jgi:hypothetical protein
MPLARDALKLSTPDTIVAAGERIQALGDAQWPEAKSDPSGVLQLLDSYLKVFAGQGLGVRQFQQAFGPESGFVLDWPASAMIPTPLAMVDVRDAAKARKFLDTLATLPFGESGFTRQDAGGISFYSLPQTGIGFFPLQITLGLTGKCLIAALNVDAVKKGATRRDAGGAGLGGMPAYQKAAGLVGEPTLSFAYVDTKAVFERIYGLFRSVASMGFVPHLSSYVDVAKLPAPETISRHLKPMISSAAEKDGGILLESAGPVTMTQATFVTAIAVGAALVPVLEQEMKGQSVSLPSFPGLPQGQTDPIQSTFASHLPHGTSTTIPAPVSSPNPRVAAPAASPSVGTP